MNTFGVVVGLIFCGMVGWLMAAAASTVVGYSKIESALVAVGATLVNAFLLFVVGGYGVKQK